MLINVLKTSSDSQKEIFLTGGAADISKSLGSLVLTIVFNETI